MALWRRGRLLRYGLAAATTLVAYVLQRIVWPFIPPSPQLFFFPSVFVTAWLAGVEAGYLATLLGCLGIAQGFLPPTGIFAIQDPRDALDLALFAVVAVGVSATMGRLHRALDREQAAAREARVAREAVEATWSMVAHDLRTPLNVIQLSSTELERRLTAYVETEDAVPTTRMLGAIQRSTDRASNLVQDAVDAMRLANGLLALSPAPCEAKKLCDDAMDSVALLAQKKHLALSVDVDAHIQVLGDGARLGQVLSNLLGNAIKFTPAGGTVKLSARVEQGQVCFSVSDDGPGIPEEEVSSIFDKFWTRDRSSGVGLGLWIAKAIVEAHGATLGVESRVGKGTTFSFALPQVELTVAATSSDASSSQ